MSKKIIFSSVLLLASGFLLLSGLHAEEKPLALSEAYALSLKRSEDIAMKVATLDTAQAHFYQALNTIMPKANYLITRKEQDASGSGNTSSDVASTGTRRVTPEKKFTFSQPIFNGFKEFAAIQASGAEKAQRVFEIERAKELLFLDVVDAFYGVLEAREDTEILNSIHGALENRIKELAERGKIGRSKDSEIQTAVVDLKMNEADLEEAKGAETIARQLLGFYIGKEIQGRLLDDNDFKRDVSDMAYYLAKSGYRSDLKASEQAKILAEKNVVAAQSGLFPTVKIDGNYYTQRVGFQSGIDWDVLLTIDIPLLNGTETIGDIKEAAASRETAKLQLGKLKRQTELDVKEAFMMFKVSGLQEKALEAAVDASKKNYELNMEDYRHNLVNNLDVLDALQKYQDVRRRLNQAHYQMLKSFWRLKVAVGETL